jgi:hypothetical protein
VSDKAPSPAGGKDKKNRWRVWIVPILLLILLLLLLIRCGHKDSGNGPSDDSASHRSDSLRVLDSLVRADSLLRARLHLDSLRLDSLRRLDSLHVSDSLRTLHRGWEARHLARLSDSLSRSRLDSLRRSDSLRALDSLARLARSRSDTIPPHVFADPAAGVHPSPVEVAVLSEESGVTPLCGPDSVHLHVCRDMIRIVDRMTLWISGVDTSGNRAVPQRMDYIIDPDASRCGPKRALVATDSVEICMDAFEYPNEPNGLPRTSVNWEEASALCAKAGKRLCSVEELTLACRGPKDWTYPYGDTYTPGHCEDSEGALARGMSKPACRSWFGAFHLTGNAWEWSSTKVGSTYYAVGGTFVDGPENKCGRTTRSFFRQNRYEALGFRCCEAAPVK